MELRGLFKDCKEIRISGPETAVITGLADDSRKVKKGDLFFAIAGQKTSGGIYIKEALAHGAAAVVAERGPDAELARLFPPAAWVLTGDVLSVLSKAASAFYGRPSERLTLTGITGTNGKTTTAYLLENIYKLAGAKPGVIGTIDYRVDGKLISKAPNTTPLAHELHALFSRMLEAGSKAVIMEVSSHALALNRADEAAFDVAVFTNIQRDHLDFHKDLESYFKAKMKIFALTASSPKKNKKGVINADDEKAGEIINAVKGRLELITFGMDKDADFKAGNSELLADRTIFELNAGGGARTVALKLLGRHNIYNALSAIAAAAAAGLDIETAVKGVETLETVPGRLEKISLGQEFGVFVDYAHTDAALENVLSNLRKLPHKKLITVFGCGGDRDRTKRAPMGRAAAAASDLAIVTSDNPRSEDPARIFADIEAGLKGAFLNYVVIPDRKEAILKAVGTAAPGDIVLIAGKGHEDYQILKDRTIHFDDREAAAEAIKWKIGGQIGGQSPAICI
ncbi:MAG: UDP-N-acetylmuramoyl-L-alanyl-D-glutamate--2,6-diaminopimelate ligase [Elusimicrobia bacterium]|nr:UDP-N-acetylmuramoyl-L-alanyl-D-glutamate--2,6-diaminopimelate ligase [Elusimicrobiota bacterium]